MNPSSDNAIEEAPVRGLPCSCADIDIGLLEDNLRLGHEQRALQHQMR